MKWNLNSMLKDIKFAQLNSISAFFIQNVHWEYQYLFASSFIFSFFSLTRLYIHKTQFKHFFFFIFLLSVHAPIFGRLAPISLHMAPVGG